MAVITAAMVKELRVKTDAPMMECKKALTEADGNMEQAEEFFALSSATRPLRLLAVLPLTALSLSTSTNRARSALSLN